MFLWMFIEGLYLHNVVTVTVFQGRFPHYFYISLGWGLPIGMTVSFQPCLARVIVNNFEIYVRQSGRLTRQCRRATKSAGTDTT
jgi:hypothetical protein